MKRFFLAIVLFFSIAVGFAQDEKTAIDLKNEGNEALRTKDYSKALQLYEQALGKWGTDPKDTAMVYNMAVCAYQTKSFDKAIKLLDESIALNYKKSTAILYKANTYKALKKDAEYLKTLEEALVLSPNDDKIKGMLASVYVKEANVFYTAGATILKTAAADVAAAKYKTTDPQYKDAEGKAKEEFKKALPIIEKALGYDPNNATAKQLKAACEQTIKG
ncbi:MAG: tetratricopeptide repeat protein [Prolixibacteraceae bacterium]|nr:tetratricopeptide repeat protein [Prolixibacteraceae bacterium]